MLQVFESCTGGELFEPIANRQFRFSEFEAATILRKLLRAMAHMHHGNIIHRDLKPENILFSEPGVDSEVKVRSNSLSVPLTLLASRGRLRRSRFDTPWWSL